MEFFFTDEAYQLTEPGRGSFGQEAIYAIFDRMVSDRDRLVVIFSGYKNEMEKILESILGLERHFFPEQNILHFSSIRQILYKIIITETTYV